jgi:hypothetical protein
MSCWPSSKISNCPRESRDVAVGIRHGRGNGREAHRALEVDAARRHGQRSLRPGERLGTRQHESSRDTSDERQRQRASMVIVVRSRARCERPGTDAGRRGIIVWRPPHWRSDCSSSFGLTTAAPLVRAAAAGRRLSGAAHRTQRLHRVRFSTERRETAGSSRLSAPSCERRPVAGGAARSGSPAAHGGRDRLGPAQHVLNHPLPRAPVHRAAPASRLRTPPALAAAVCWHFQSEMELARLCRGSMNFDRGSDDPERPLAEGFSTKPRLERRAAADSLDGRSPTLSAVLPQADGPRQGGRGVSPGCRALRSTTPHGQAREPPSWGERTRRGGR